MKKSIDLKKLIHFYERGFFPMAKNRHEKLISFYKPEKRFIIPIKNFHIPKKLFNIFKKNEYNIKINYNFEKVINLCQQIKRKDGSTWINDIIINTYTKLNKLNICHSIEYYENNKLVGGLYGMHLGKCFFGESMFSLKPNTSKICLIYLIAILKKNGFILLDSQFYNPHLLQFGAYEISNNEYEILLNQGLNSKANFKEMKNFHEVLSIIQSISHKS